MKGLCFCCFVALVAMLLCLETVKGTEGNYKVNEAGQSPTDGFFCGQVIKDMFNALCSSTQRKRRSTFMDEREALSFLHYRSPRSTGSTNIVRECCIESCAYEEIKEYC